MYSIKRRMSQKHGKNTIFMQGHTNTCFPFLCKKIKKTTLTLKKRHLFFEVLKTLKVQFQALVLSLCLKPEFPSRL